MGHQMIAGGGSGESPNRSLVDMATGLDIVPELVVDQHFHNRNRMARLVSAVAATPTKLALALMRIPVPYLKPKVYCGS